MDKLVLGSAYGGYAVVPALLGPGRLVYSFGVGEDASFDLAMIERFGAQVHAFDPTPRSLAWVEQQSWPDGFVFHPMGLGATDGTLTLHPPPKADHVSFSPVARKGAGAPVTVPVKTAATLMDSLGHGTLDILKADIEGAEYDVIDQLVRDGPQPDQLLLEFHHHLPGIAWSQTKRAIATLREAGYALFDQSEAGPEMSFVRRSALARLP